jgi:ammonium transporter, Amt family
VLVIGNELSGRVAARAAVCTTLSGAAGGIATLLSGFRRQKAWDLVCLCNGTLVGFVAVTACCHVIEPWAAIICGFTAGLVFDGGGYFIYIVILLWYLDNGIQG